MSKILAIFAFLLVSSMCLTNKEILQQGLNGIFEQNRLPDPKTIVPCIDEDTAGKIVSFIGVVLEKAAKGSIADIVSLIDLVKKFADEIPQSVKDCLDGNAEFEALGLKYGIDNTTETSTIEKKIITYVTLHYITVHKWMGTLNDEWKASKFYQTGYDAATYAHNIFSVSKLLTKALEHIAKALSLPNLTNKEILQQALNGLFEENKLPDPTTIVPCIDEDTAGKIVKFIGVVLDKAAKGSVGDIISLIDMIKKFGDEIPQPVKDCLDGNAEFKALGLKYHIDDTTDKSALEKKIIAYVTLHYFEVHKWLGELDGLWKSGKYYQTGFNGAGYGHKVLGFTPEDIKKILAALA